MCERLRRERGSYSQDHKILIVNALELIRKVGKQREPAVIAVLERLAQPDLVKALHAEERAYLASFA